jgi:hypothetical protein
MQKASKRYEQEEIERKVRQVPLVRAVRKDLETATLTAGCKGKIKRRQRSDDHANGPHNKQANAHRYDSVVSQVVEIEREGFV